MATDSVADALSASRAVYCGLPPCVAATDVGYVHTGGHTEFFVPGGHVSVMEMGLTLEREIGSGLVTLREEDGMAVVSVMYGNSKATQGEAS